MKLNCCEECKEPCGKPMKISERCRAWLYIHPSFVIKSVTIIISIIFLTAIIFPIFFSPTYFAEAIVTDIGYKGIIVTYKGEYGEDRLQTIDVNNPSEYRVGEIITIQIYDGGGIKGIVANEHT